jgi:predicted kinase
MKKLYLMHAPPGAGKSFTARQLAGETGVVYATDDFFPEDRGNYQALAKKAIEKGFWGRMLCKFHMQNVQRTIEAMERGVSPIVIDNVNNRRKEAQPYIDAGKQHGYSIEIAEPDCPRWQEIRQMLWNKKFYEAELRKAAEELAARNQHGVPADRIFQFLMEWHEWNV